MMTDSAVNSLAATSSTTSTFSCRGFSMYTSSRFDSGCSQVRTPEEREVGDEMSAIQATRSIHLGWRFRITRPDHQAVRRGGEDADQRSSASDRLVVDPDATGAAPEM